MERLFIVSHETHGDLSVYYSDVSLMNRLSHGGEPCGPQPGQPIIVAESLSYESNMLSLILHFQQCEVCTGFILFSRTTFSSFHVYVRKKRSWLRLAKVSNHQKVIYSFLTLAVLVVIRKRWHKRVYNKSLDRFEWVAKSSSVSITWIHTSITSSMAM